MPNTSNPERVESKQDLERRLITLEDRIAFLEQVTAGIVLERIETQRQIALLIISSVNSLP